MTPIEKAELFEELAVLVYNAQDRSGFISASDLMTELELAADRLRKEDGRK